MSVVRSISGIKITTFNKILSEKKSTASSLHRIMVFEVSQDSVGGRFQRGDSVTCLGTHPLMIVMASSRGYQTTVNSALMVP